MNKKFYYTTILIFALAIALPYPLFWLTGGLSAQENKENRTLAEFPEFKMEKWDQYFSDLDAYINDYAPFKNQVVSAYNSLQVDVFGGVDINSQVIVGEDEWLFSRHDRAYKNYKKFDSLTEAEENKFSELINEMDALCQERGIFFCVGIMPNKEQIYGEYMPAQIKVAEDQQSRIEILIEHTRRTSNVSVVYPKAELIAEKENNPVYYKYDSHWNRIGGFIGAQQIIGEITGARMYVNEIEWDVRYDRIGDLAITLNMDSRYNDDGEFNGDYLSEIEFEIVEQSSDSRFIHTVCEDAENDEVLLVICDSFTNNMRQYLAKNFKECYFVRRELAFSEDFNIMSCNPDVIVFQVVERLAEQVVLSGIPKFVTDMAAE